MQFRIKLLPRASQDLMNLHSHVLQESPIAGQRWYNGLFEAIDSLRNNPKRCAFAADPYFQRRDVRQLLYGPRPNVYRILFRVLEDEDIVEILHIRHGARRPV